MIKGKREKIYLIGHNISGSISPAIQNAAFSKLELPIDYSILDIESEKLDDVMNNLHWGEVRGLNVTVPFKERIIKYLLRLDPRALAIGAVNTVGLSPDRELCGYNTDYDGIVATLNSLDPSCSFKDKTGIILGAGGAARACLYALAEKGVRSIFIFNRTEKKADQLAKTFARRFPNVSVESEPLDCEKIASKIGTCDILVNSISVSTGLSFPIRLDFFRNSKPDMKVFDLGYREPSLLLKSARSRGLQGRDGVPMLVEQAVSSIEIWTGVSPPRKEMMTVALQSVKELEDSKTHF